MKSEFIDLVGNLAELNISNLPNYKTMLAIGRHTEAKFPNPMETAARIKIEVNECFVNNPTLFNTTVDAYVKVLNNIWDQLKKDMPEEVANRVFVIMASTMTLSYTYPMWPET
jgi:hypothetical protein